MRSPNQSSALKSWKDIGFEIESTEDGSLSLRMLQSVDPEKFKGESMHHSGGAWAETLLIYGEPLKDILTNQPQPRFMIVGLGLGYIEMTIARQALLLGLSSAQVAGITSYESVPELREYFIEWLHDRVDALHPEVAQTYDKVLTDIISGTSLGVGEVKNFLRPHFSDSSVLKSAMTAEEVFTERYHGIMYDAFSSKTTPHLWEDTFLDRLLQEASEAHCQFSTYACRVGLKAALRNHGFEVIVRPGFKGKRNSTLGKK